MLKPIVPVTVGRSQQPINPLTFVVVEETGSLGTFSQASSSFRAHKASTTHPNRLGETPRGLRELVSPSVLQHEVFEFGSSGVPLVP